MVATVTDRPFVSLLAACAYCPASTSFACLRCGTAMCPTCVCGDYCPECQPAPVAPLPGFSMVNEGNGAPDATFYAVECQSCGDRIYTEDPDEDAYCAACSLPAAEIDALRMVPAPRPTPAACAFCGAPMYGRAT